MWSIKTPLYKSYPHYGSNTKWPMWYDGKGCGCGWIKTLNYRLGMHIAKSKMNTELKRKRNWIPMYLTVFETSKAAIQPFLLHSHVVLFVLYCKFRAYVIFGYQRTETQARGGCGITYKSECQIPQSPLNFKFCTWKLIYNNKILFLAFSLCLGPSIFFSS